MEVFKCQNCGANNIIHNESIKCDYCNTVSYRKPNKQIIFIDAMDCGKIGNPKLPEMPKCRMITE